MIFDENNWIWLHLRKDRFSQQNSTLMGMVLFKSSKESIIMHTS